MTATFTETNSPTTRELGAPPRVQGGACQRQARRVSPRVCARSRRQEPDATCKKIVRNSHRPSRRAYTGDMNAQTRPGWLSRLLDGENRWGFARVQVDRFGVTRYRLVVYPPGISDIERRRLRVWRGSPIWGTALWVMAEIYLQQAIGTVGRAGDLLDDGHRLGRHRVVMAGDMRTKVRMVGVVTMPGQMDAATIAARDRLEGVGLDAVRRRRARQRRAHVAARTRGAVVAGVRPAGTDGSTVFDGHWSRGASLRERAQTTEISRRVAYKHARSRGGGTPRVTRGSVPARGTRAR